MFDRETAAHQQVKAYQLAIFGNRHEVHVVSVQIDIVLRRITTVVLNLRGR